MSEALRLFSVYTGGSFRSDDLLGKQKASCRAHIMSAIKGSKATQAESGINALEQALCDHLGISDWTCYADRDHKLYARCHELAKA